MAQDFLARTVNLSIDDKNQGMSVCTIRPDTAEPLPSCLLFPEIFGLTPAMNDAAERLAQAGFVVAMPDLNHRSQANAVLLEDADGRERGLSLLRMLCRPTVLEDIGATLAYLKARDDTTDKAAAIGFSSGGHIAYLAATAFDLDLAVTVYGGWIANSGIPLSQPDPTITLTPKIKRHGAHVLYIVGDRDHLITADQTATIEEALKEAGISHEIMVCQNAGHGYLVPSRPTYDPSAAEETWDRILAQCAALKELPCV